MTKRIGIFGAGAVGSYIGAFLTKEGHDVTLIDMWGEHVNAMKSKGLSVTGTQGEFNIAVNAVHLSEIHNIRDSFDILFFAVKSYDTEWAAHLVKHLLCPRSVVVDSQNCMNDQVLAAIVGYEREIGCVMSGITVALWEPGQVSRGGKPGRDTGHDVFRVGELHGRVTHRVQEVSDILNSIDGSRPTQNIWGERWSKLTTNASSNPVGAMTGWGSLDVAGDNAARLIQIHICKESVQVAMAANFDVEPIKGVDASIWARADEGEIFEELDAKFRPNANARNWRSSMAQDVVKGRRTEIDFMNGHIVKEGRRVNVATPVNAAVLRVVKEIDLGIRTPAPANISEILVMTDLS